MMLSGYIVEKYNNMTGAYTCHRLAEEARRRGMRIDIVGVHDCCLTKDGLRNSSIKLDHRDFVINRYKWGKIKDAINGLSSRSYNRIEVYDIYKNKYEQLRRLSSRGFKVPRHLLATSMMPFDILSQYLPAPFVVKGLENSMGREVMLVESESDYLKLRESEIDREWLFEEYISSSYGRDLRLFAIRGKAVACMMRKSKGDFRANVALGATVEQVEVTPVMQLIAGDICRLTGLDFVGIDLLFGDSGYYLCEINVMPGLEGIESASGLNIAGMIIDMIKSDFENGPA